MRFYDCQALGYKFVLALDPRDLKLEGSSIGIRPSIHVLRGCYKDTPRGSQNSHFGGANIFAPPPHWALEPTKVVLKSNIWKILLLA